MTIAPVKNTTQRSEMKEAGENSAFAPAPPFEQTDSAAATIVDGSRTEQERREHAIALLQSLRDAEGEEAQDQRDTYDYLVAALNANLAPGERRRM